MGQQGIFNFGGVGVKPSDDEHVLDAISNRQIPIGIHNSDVTCM